MTDVEETPRNNETVDDATAVVEVIRQMSPVTLPDIADLEDAMNNCWGSVTAAEHGVEEKKEDDVRAMVDLEEEQGQEALWVDDEGDNSSPEKSVPPISTRKRAGFFKKRSQHISKNVPDKAKAVKKAPNVLLIEEEKKTTSSAIQTTREDRFADADNKPSRVAAPPLPLSASPPPVLDATSQKQAIHKARAARLLMQQALTPSADAGSPELLAQSAFREALVARAIVLSYAIDDAVMQETSQRGVDAVTQSRRLLSELGKPTGGAAAAAGPPAPTTQHPSFEDAIDRSKSADEHAKIARECLESVLPDIPGLEPAEQTYAVIVSHSTPRGSSLASPDGISTLGFDNTFDKGNMSKEMDVLSMSSLNEILDGPLDETLHSPPTKTTTLPPFDKGAAVTPPPSTVHATKKVSKAAAAPNQAAFTKNAAPKATPTPTPDVVPPMQPTRSGFGLFRSKNSRPTTNATKAPAATKTSSAAKNTATSKSSPVARASSSPRRIHRNEKQIQRFMAGIKVGEDREEEPDDDEFQHLQRFQDVDERVGKALTDALGDNDSLASAEGVKLHGREFKRIESSPVQGTPPRASLSPGKPKKKEKNRLFRKKAVVEQPAVIETSFSKSRTTQPPSFVTAPSGLTPAVLTAKSWDNLIEQQAVSSRDRVRPEQQDQDSVSTVSGGDNGDDEKDALQKIKYTNVPDSVDPAAADGADPDLVSALASPASTAVGPDDDKYAIVDKSGGAVADDDKYAVLNACAGQVCATYEACWGVVANDMPIDDLVPHDYADERAEDYDDDGVDATSLRSNMDQVETEMIESQSRAGFSPVNAEQQEQMTGENDGKIQTATGSNSVKSAAPDTSSAKSVSAAAAAVVVAGLAATTSSSSGGKMKSDKPKKKTLRVAKFFRRNRTLPSMTTVKPPSSDLALAKSVPPSMDTVWLPNGPSTEDHAAGDESTTYDGTATTKPAELNGHAKTLEKLEHVATVTHDEADTTVSKRSSVVTVPTHGEAEASQSNPADEVLRNEPSSLADTSQKQEHSVKHLDDDAVMEHVSIETRARDDLIPGKSSDSSKENSKRKGWFRKRTQSLKSAPAVAVTRLGSSDAKSTYSVGSDKLLASLANDEQTVVTAAESALSPSARLMQQPNKTTFESTTGTSFDEAEKSEDEKSRKSNKSGSASAVALANRFGDDIASADADTTEKHGPDESNKANDTSSTAPDASSSHATDSLVASIKEQQHRQRSGVDPEEEDNSLSVSSSRRGLDP